MRNLFIALLFVAALCFGYFYTDITNQIDSKASAHHQLILDDWVNRLNKSFTVLARILGFNKTMVNNLAYHNLGVKYLLKPVDVQFQDTSSGIQVSSGDRGVKEAFIHTADRIIHNISIPILQNNLGKTPSKNVQIVLFSSKESYAAELSRSGVTRNLIPNIVTHSAGITVGQDIWIPLYTVQDNSDLANVLTHELTHAVLNEQGIGNQLSTWINEGIAWHNGMLGMSQVSQAEAKQKSMVLNQQITQAARNGQLLPLSAGEADILRTHYNVEWEDYLAVENLIQKNGEQNFKAFLNNIPQIGLKKSFLKQFNEPINQYESEALNRFQ